MPPLTGLPFMNEVYLIKNIFFHFCQVILVKLMNEPSTHFAERLTAIEK